MPKPTYLISVLTALLLSGCAHQSVSLADIQLAQVQVTQPEVNEFRWAWLAQEADNSEFTQWLNRQQSRQLLACICLPPEEPDSQLLFAGWRNIQPLIEQAKQQGFAVEVELKTAFTGPEILFRNAAGVQHGR
ncbi:hypothetical protein [Reinekea marinisedimentorum]|uniref:Uncharacterized protein n=1 Tax=Reinekea marinisedimentorum TaxID=230495 RepID=A0A4R3IAV6_9GAMM|nr:hypothetical protein [Reinekea marinisedimentorum]TCS42381.1 hypothetical protein BCF53_10342 [Reinekea marinisedimentorum]